MLIAGLMTCSMIVALFFPQETIESLFGVSLTDPLANLIVRSWGLLIFLMGTLLIYGAYVAQYRYLAILITSISKAVFVVLLLIFGQQYLDKTLSTIILDTIVVIVFSVYLIKIKR